VTPALAAVSLKMPVTISELLTAAQAEAIALAAPGRMPLSYARLRQQMTETASAFRIMGIGRRDRVAIVLANGPEMATALLSVMTAAVAAPLNPVYRTEEFDFYFSDLGVKAVVVETGSNTPAVAVAKARGIAIVELIPRREEQAGLFRLHGASGNPAAGEPAAATDVALLLHTSGTTSRPKLAPLSHQNL
jgi:acyl-CoA synthetase (AMP-forming)/AMP-acid ligase II